MADNKVGRVPGKSGSERQVLRDQDSGEVKFLKPGVFSDSKESTGVKVDTDAEALAYAEQVAKRGTKEEKDP